MVWTVLKYVFIGMVFLLAGAWLYAGGWTKTVAFVRTVPNPIDILWGNATSTYGGVSLPWQIPIPQGPDISAYVDAGEDAIGSMSAEERLQYLQSEYDQLQKEAAQQNRSPFAGMVKLSRATAKESSPNSEYVVIDTTYSARAISLNGWTLMSVLTGIRVPIPHATRIYAHGSLNTTEAVVLEPGANAIVVSGSSPLGVSFQETRCTGYLAQALSIDPPLANACPSPSESMSLTDQNLQRYGGDCVDYVQSIPQCTFPRSVPAALSTACKVYIANTFSYNGCVQSLRAQRDFALDTWRLYVHSSAELWRNDHDSIRLLDEYGRTVDSLTY